MGKPREVTESNVGVGTKVAEDEIKDELNDLNTGNPLLPPNSTAASSKEVVTVHDNMNVQVQANNTPLDGGATEKLSKAQESRNTMVVAMEKGKGFLLQKQEHRIHQLQVLGQVIEVVQGNQSLRKMTRIANAVEETVTHVVAENLFYQQSKQSSTDDSQNEVVKLKKTTLFQRFAICHDRSTTQDDNIVSGNGYNYARPLRHGSFTRDVLKFRGIPSYSFDAQLLKQMPIPKLVLMHNYALLTIGPLQMDGQCWVGEFSTCVLRLDPFSAEKTRKSTHVHNKYLSLNFKIFFKIF